MSCSPTHSAHAPDACGSGLSLWLIPGLLPLCPLPAGTARRGAAVLQRSTLTPRRTTGRTPRLPTGTSTSAYGDCCWEGGSTSACHERCWSAFAQGGAVVCMRKPPVQAPHCARHAPDSSRAGPAIREGLGIPLYHVAIHCCCALPCYMLHRPSMCHAALGMLLTYSVPCCAAGTTSLGGTEARAASRQASYASTRQARKGSTVSCPRRLRHTVMGPGQACWAHTSRLASQPASQRPVIPVCLP
jgi:hypothetical protein